MLSMLVLALNSCDNSSKKIDAQAEGKSNQQEEISVNGLPKQSSPEADSVMEAINQKIRKDVNNPDLYIERSGLYELLGDNRAAVEDIDRALRIDSTNLNTLIAQADFLLKRGELNTSARILEHAKTLHPEASIIYQKLSELYLVAGNNKLSMENADNAVKYDKFNPKAYYLKGFNFIQLKDTTKSISSFRTAVEQDPEFFEAYMQLGTIFASLHDPISLDYFNNALEVKPGNKEALYGIGMYQQENGLYNDAFITYAKLTKAHPNFKEAHFNIGYTHMYYLQMYSEAKSYFTDAINVDPNYYQAYYNRGYCHELLGDIRNAELDYKKALSIQPDYTLAAEGLSRLKEQP